MKCPNCGLQTVPDQKFCRSCGASLQLTTQPLAEHPTVSGAARMPALAFKDQQQRANRLTPLGFIIMFIGVAIGVIGKMLMHQEMVTVIGVLVSLVGMFLTVYPYLSPSPRRKYDPNQSIQPEIPLQAQPTRSLAPESNIAYVPSITERTTDLLKNSPAPGPGQKEGRIPTEHHENPGPES